jgi:hypothetical protein
VAPVSGAGVRPAPDPVTVPDGLPHFLLTNFNVRRGWTRDVHGTAVLTEEWLEHRWQLFETFCLPSVRGQSRQRFHWLVRFDPATPERHRERFRRLTGDMPNVTPLWHAEPFSATILRLLDRSAARLLTTRLDNDDALHRDALPRVQDAVGATCPEFLNLTNGYRLVRPEGRLVRMAHASNPFLSLVEPVPARWVGRTPPVALLALAAWLERSRPVRRLARLLPRAFRARRGLLLRRPLLTVRCISHNHAAEIAPVRQLGGAPAWLQVVHERNARATAGSWSTGIGPAGSVECLSAFGVRLPGGADAGSG